MVDVILAAENIKVGNSVLDSDQPMSSTLSGPNMFQLLSGMAIVIGAIIVILWLLKKLGRMTMTANNQIQVLGGVSLGAREKLVLVQIGEKQIVIGVAPGSVRTLHVLDQVIKIDESTDSFSKVFSEKIKKVVSREGKK